MSLLSNGHLQNDPSTLVKDREGQALNSQQNRWHQFTKLPVWDLAFRPWFLLASLSSIASLSLWLLFLNGVEITMMQTGLSPVVWHVHEMVFGFAATVALAFLLTAIQTWTGLRSIHGTTLIALTSLWLGIRFCLWSGDLQWLWIGFYLQGAWWVLSITALTRLLIKADNRRNFLFVPLLSTMMLINLSVLYFDLTDRTDLALHLSRTSILLFGLLVGIVGGRVIPFFTERGAYLSRVKKTPLLNRYLIFFSILGILLFASSYFFPMTIAPAIIMFITGALHLLRLFYWDSWATRNNALLWSLHFSYGFLGIGLIALGSSYFFERILLSHALHIITLGTIGGMILAMMARVSLGHTGRALAVNRFISLAFAFMFIATLLRFLFSLFYLPLIAWNLSAVLWISAFFIFVVFYTKVLLKKRQN